MFDKIKEVASNMMGPKEEKLEEHKYKNEVIDFVFRELERRRQERLPLELEWRLCINFLQGNQHVQVNTHSGDIEAQDPFAWWEEREVFNQLAPIFETRLSKLGRLNVLLKVRPATGDADDIASAKVSTKILESTDRDQNMDQKQAESNAWSEKVGTSFVKEIWNPDKGRIIGELKLEPILDSEKNQEPEEFEKEFAKKQQGVKKIREGDTETAIIPAFEIYPDSIFNATVKDCRSIQHVKVYDIEEVFNKWGQEVKGEKNNVFTLKGGTSGSGGLGQKGYGYSISTSTKEKSALVVEHWELPSRKFPDGRLIICTKDTLLYYGALPYKDENEDYYIPIKEQKCVENNMFFGESILKRLIPIQRRYNSIKNRKKEFLNRAAIGQLTYEEGSIDEELLEEDGLSPGQAIAYKRGFNPPQYMNSASLPSTFESDEAGCNNDFNRISGVSEISRDSSAPTGVNSGIALSVLQEQDDTRISLSANNIQNARIEQGKMRLRLLKQFASLPRIAKTYNKNDMPDVIHWTKNDLTSFDVYIDNNSSLSDTPAQRRQMIFDLMGAGLFNDPETGALTREGQSKIFEMLEIGDWENFDDKANIHVDKTKRENMMMLQGHVPQAKSYDDDIIHVREHNNMRLTAEFEEMLTENQQLDMIFEEHITQHLKALQEQAKQEQMQQAQQPQQQAPQRA